MYHIILLFSLALVAARPNGDLAYDSVNNGDGSYSYRYDAPGGISVYERGAPRAAGQEGPAVTAEGGFSYIAPDGQQISLTYTADENGFHPVGSHLPTPPPTPEAILASLRLLGRQAHSGESDSVVVENGGYKY